MSDPIPQDNAQSIDKANDNIKKNTITIDPSLQSDCKNTSFYSFDFF